jgi:hypothetical protein
MSLGGRPCALGTKREIVPAVPMDQWARLDNYAVQNGGGDKVLTPRQRRRWLKKKHAQAARARRALARELAAVEDSS